MTSLKKQKHLLVTCSLVVASIPLYASAEQPIAVKSVWLQQHGNTYEFPFEKLSPLIAAGFSDITHLVTLEDKVIAMKDFSAYFAAFQKEANDTINDLIGLNKQLTPTQLAAIPVQQGAVSDGQLVGDGTIAPGFTQPIISNAVSILNTTTAIAVSFRNLPVNFEQKLQDKTLQLKDSDNNILTLVYSGGGITNQTALFRIQGGMRLEDKKEYTVMQPDWVNAIINDQLIIKSEPSYVVDIIGGETEVSPSKNDAQGKPIPTHLTYFAQSQYGETLDLPSTTKISELRIGDTIINDTDYTFTSGKLTINVAVPPKTTITTTFTYDVNGQTQQSVVTTAVKDVDPAVLSSIQLSYPPKDYYAGDKIKVTANLFDQYGKKITPIGAIKWSVNGIDNATNALTAEFDVIEGKQSFKIEVDGKSQTIMLEGKPAPTLEKVEIKPISFIAKDATFAYQPIVAKNTKGETFIPDISSWALEPTKNAKLVYVKKVKNEWVAVNKDEAEVAAIEYDVKNFEQPGEHTYTIKDIDGGSAKIEVKEARKLYSLDTVKTIGLGVNDTNTLTVIPKDQYGQYFALPSTPTIMSENASIVITEPLIPIFTNNSITGYKANVRGVGKGSTQLVVTSGAITTKIAANVTNAEIKSVKTLSAKSFEVTFNRAVTDVDTNNISLDGAGLVRSVKFSADYTKATVELYDPMQVDTTYNLSIFTGGESLTSQVKYTEGIARTLNVSNQTVIQGQPMVYQVLDANGIDITANQTVTVKTDPAYALVAEKGMVRLAVNAPKTFKATLSIGSIEKTVTITTEPVKSEPRKIAPSFTLTTEAGRLEKEVAPVKSLAIDELDRYLNVGVLDQYGNYTKDGTITYEPLTASVLAIDANGKLIPRSPGRASIKVSVTHEGTVFSQIIGLEVLAKPQLTAIKASQNNIIITTDGVIKQADITVTGLDQYNRPMDLQAIEAVIADSAIAEAKADAVGGKVTITQKAVGDTMLTLSVGAIQTTIPVTVKATGVHSHYEIGDLTDLYFVNNPALQQSTKFEPKLYSVDNNGLWKEVKVDTANAVVRNKNNEVVTIGTGYQKLINDGPFTVSFDGYPDIVRTFSIIDNRQKPTIDMINNTVTAKSGGSLKDALQQQIRLLDPLGIPLDWDIFKSATFTSLNPAIIDSNSDNLKESSTSSNVTLLFDSLTVTYQGQEIELPFKETIKLIVDNDPPAVKQVSGLVEHTEKAKFGPHFGMSFEATNPGVDGNTITIALVPSTNPTTTVTVANKDITIGVGEDAATLTRKKLIDLINNHKDAKKLIVASTTMPEANLLNGTDKVLLNKVSLKDGISQLTEVMLTFSESVAYAGDFMVNDEKTEATPIGDNDRILLHSFANPIPLTEASTTFTIKIKTPEVKDKVGNTTQEAELTKHFILTDNQLLEKP